MSTAKQNQKKNFHNQDTLWMLRFISIDFCQNRLVKLFLRFLTVALTILTVVQTIFFFTKWDRYYFIKYLPLYAGNYCVSLYFNWNEVLLE